MWLVRHCLSYRKKLSLNPLRTNCAEEGEEPPAKAAKKAATCGRKRQPTPRKRQPTAGGSANQRRGNAAKGGRKRQPKPWKGSQGREESASKAAEMAAVKLRREKILKKMSRGKFYASMLWLLFSCKNVPIILMYGSKSSFSAGFVPAGVD